ncbi:MAG TPA: MFS transporter [Acidobacteriota bacterium]|jgi:NNP family nitrate/nitrite transporter-like MFS transporter
MTEPNKNLTVTTIAFAITFSTWGLIAALAPAFKATYRLTATQASFMIAIPVILGSVGRLPMGWLADRFGPRAVMGALLLLGVIPPLALSRDHMFHSLLIWGFFLGLAGTSFPVGVALVSGWFPRERVGFALGIYGAGNIGQSIAVFFAPLLARQFGIGRTFLLFGLASLLWGLSFLALAKNAPQIGPVKKSNETIRLFRDRQTYILSLFYFLTFGGFVALAIYLPTLLREIFSLSAADAGARTAGFVLLATAARPMGGWLSDKYGGNSVLSVTFAGLAAVAWFMACPNMVVFTVGALGCAALLGLGNGAVFKLVPQYFPKQTGTVTGVVGAAGGLGGFFPPLVLGVFRDHLGSYVFGFILLSLFAACCLLLHLAQNRKAVLKAQQAPGGICLQNAARRVAGDQ